MTRDQFIVWSVKLKGATMHTLVTVKENTKSRMSMYQKLKQKY